MNQNSLFFVIVFLTAIKPMYIPLPLAVLSLTPPAVVTNNVTMQCVCVVIPFILDVRFVDVPAGVTQEEGHTGFLIHLPSAVLALIFLARRLQPFLSLVDFEVEFCVLTI